jgi:uncharacterized protein YkwD
VRRSTFHLVFAALVVGMVLLPDCAVVSACGRATRQERLTLPEARAYLLELINKDRATLGRLPLESDPVATRVGQKQAEFMVRVAAMTHADAEGRLPVQRYTEEGGRDRIRENVSLTGGRVQLIEEIRVDPQPTFTRAEIEAVEANYFNQIAPNDRHRRNILSPTHTHVGIGLARGVEDNAAVIGSAEEFVDRFFDELAPLPSRAQIGQKLTLEGRLSRGRRLIAVGLAHSAPSRPLSREELRAARTYVVPAPHTKYWADEARPDVRFTEQANGGFSITTPLGEVQREGLTYVSLWLRDPVRGEVLGSIRTVNVRASETVRDR